MAFASLLAASSPVINGSGFPDLYQNVFNLRDLVLQDRIPGYHANPMVKQQLRMPDVTLSATDVERVISLLAGPSPLASEDHTKAPNIFARLPWLDEFLASKDTRTDTRLRPDAEAHPRSFEVDDLLRKANTLQYKLSEMQNAWMQIAASLEASDTSANDRTKRRVSFGSYYSSQPPESRTASPDIPDANAAMSMVDPLLTQAVTQSLMDAGQPIPPDLEAVLRSLQQTNVNSTASQAPQLEEEEYNPPAAESDEGDEYDPMELDVESEYEPVEPARPQSMSPHVPVVTNRLTNIAAPQPSRVSPHAVSRIDDRGQASQQPSARVVRPAVDKKAERRERLRERREKKKQRERDEQLAKEKLNAAKREEKRRRREARRVQAPAPAPPPPPPVRSALPPPLNRIPPPPRPPTGAPAVQYGTVNPYVQPAYHPRPPSVVPPMPQPVVQSPVGYARQPASARLLAPGESVVVRDQYGNTFIARPVAPAPPLPPPPVHRYPY